MSRVKTIKKQIGDDNLADMFNKILNDQGDEEIVMKKQEIVTKNLRKISVMLRTYEQQMRVFTEYTWQRDFLDLDAKINHLLTLSDYSALKNHNDMRHVVVLCSKLMEFKHYVVADPPNERYITVYPGMNFEPFDFTTFDIKILWNNPRVGALQKEFTLRIIKAIFQSSEIIYENITTPDVDVKKFSEIIIASLARLKEIPELNRCRDAFQKIEESVSLLENNFNTYFKDMLNTENPNTIIENYILDVSKNVGNGASPTLIQQFRKIITYYRKSQANNGAIKDPKMKELLDNMEKRMNMIGGDVK